MTNRLSATFLLATAALATAAPPTTNPADLYREVSRLITAARNDPFKYDEVDATPVDAALAAYLQRQQRVLDLMHQCAALPRADWGPLDTNINKVMGSLNNARSAVVLTWLAARQDLAQNRPADAVTHLLDGIALARHVGQYPLLVNHLVEIGCETGSIKRLARLVPTLPPEVAADLPKRLDALPPYVGWPAIIDGERVLGRKMLADQMAAAKNAAKANPNAAGDDKIDPQEVDAVPAMADALGPLYDAAKGTPGQTPADIAKAINAAVAKMPNNVLAEVLAPSLARAREPSAALEAQFAMLRVAAATAAGDADALSNSVDPFGGKPFGYEAVPGGFRLKSELTFRGEPVTLTVGQ